MRPPAKGRSTKPSQLQAPQELIESKRSTYLLPSFSLHDRENDQEIGDYLVSPLFSMNGGAEGFWAEDKPYELELRFKRIDKPYSVTLVDFIKEELRRQQHAEAF